MHEVVHIASGLIKNKPTLDEDKNNVDGLILIITNIFNLPELIKVGYIAHTDKIIK